MLSLPKSPEQSENNGTLSSLTCLLCTNQGNDTAQFCTLRGCLLDDLLIHALLFRQVGRALEHTILEGEHLLQSVVEEGSAKADVAARGSVEAHLEFARTLFLGRLFEHLTILLLLGSVMKVSDKND